MKKKKIPQNYLEKIPSRKEGLDWSQREDGLVDLHLENKGFFNTLAQKLLKKPRFTHIHLDELGSFVWPLLDGKQDIIALGEKVKEHFGEKAEPLYPRLAKYFQILESYHFIEFIEQ
ncbi:MAG: PqqD family protein [Clostridia bacterium]|nr:PqqD family protein [Clostridia bacterium]